MQDQTITQKHEASRAMQLRTLERPPVDDALIQEITRRIVEGVSPRRIILFGSRARGDARPDSDIDLFVEMDSPESRLDRYMEVRRFLRGLGVPIDVMVMTPQEVASRRNSVVSMVPVIEREGRILFQAHGIH